VCVPTIRASTKGQVVIPVEVRRRLGIEPGTRLSVDETEGGVLLRVLPDDPIEAARGHLAHLGPFTDDLVAERRREAEREERSLPAPRRPGS